MKKKTIYMGIAAAVLVVAAICGGICAWKIHKKNAMIGQQNYVASRLIELGEYEQGRILAAQTQQMKPNAASERLLVLAAGFQTEYEAGIRYADQYLERGEDKLLASAKTVYEEALELMEGEPELYSAQTQEVHQALLPLLLQVQNSISTKKNDDSILAVVDLLSGGGNASIEAVLEEDHSLLSQKAQIAYAIQTSDYGKAYEKAEALYLESGTFENRAALANLAAAQDVYLAEDEQTVRLRNKQAELGEELCRLMEQYAQETRSSKISRIMQRMEELQGRIEEIQREINAIPRLKAINFMEATTPVTERSTVAYKIELAQLYYRAGQNDRAEELLTDVITTDRADAEPVSLMLSDFLRAYTDSDSRTDYLSYMYVENDDVAVLWNRIAQMLGFVESRYSYGETSFYDFVRNLLDTLYNGVIIRSIDATDFPTVRVTVNVPVELEHALTERDFSLVEMGEDLRDFKLLNIEELQDAQAMSVALVVDRSGSMEGTRMADTKQAVTNFVKTIDEAIDVGLVAFDSEAQLISPIANNKNDVLQRIASLVPNGGTNIYSGLKLAGQTLEAEAGRRVIILLSDGEDGNAGMIDEVLDELVSKDIYVYTIGFGGADSEYLSYIARKCGGKFIQADSSSMLREIYSSVGEYMTNDYVIEFHVVTEPEKFTRTIKVLTDINNAFAEREYHVGVPYDVIEAEQDRKPLADYFQQVGGSRMETE